MDWIHVKAPDQLSTDISIELGKHSKEDFAFFLSFRLRTQCFAICCSLLTRNLKLLLVHRIVTGYELLKRRRNFTVDVFFASSLNHVNVCKQKRCYFPAMTMQVHSVKNKFDKRFFFFFRMVSSFASYILTRCSTSRFSMSMFL